MKPRSKLTRWRHEINVCGGRLPLDWKEKKNKRRWRTLVAVEKSTQTRTIDLCPVIPSPRIYIYIYVLAWMSYYLLIPEESGGTAVTVLLNGSNIGPSIWHQIKRSAWRWIKPLFFFCTCVAARFEFEFPVDDVTRHLAFLYWQFRQPVRTSVGPVAFSRPLRRSIRKPRGYISDWSDLMFRIRRSEINWSVRGRPVWNWLLIFFFLEYL